MVFPAGFAPSALRKSNGQSAVGSWYESGLRNLNMRERRDFFKRLAGMGAAFWAGGKAAVAQQHQHGPDHTSNPMQGNASGQPAGVEQGIARGKTQPPAGLLAQSKRAFNVPVETPDLPKLPFQMVDGWKEFNLIAEVIETEL